jgi:hypothetical protein
MKPHNNILTEIVNVGDDIEYDLDSLLLDPIASTI